MIYFNNKDRTWGFLCPSYERKIEIERRAWISVAALHYGMRLGYDTDWAEQVRFEKTSVDALAKYREIRDKGANHPVVPASGQDMQNMLWACDSLLQQHLDLREALERSGNEELIYKNASPYWGEGSTQQRGANVQGKIWTALRNHNRSKQS